VFRTLDDLVDDGAASAALRVGAVKAWARGDSAAPTDEVLALESLAQRHPISRRAVADFCLGMEQDMARATFASERELDRYCYRVAGTVGVVMTALLASEDGDEDAQGCAVALGIAMQRTNILRDIDEDAAAGRVYITQEALSAHGGSLEPSRRAGLMRAQIARADDYYAEGLAGIRTLRDGQLAIRLAANLYREILREIERRDGGRVPGRAVVSGRRKAAVAGRTLLTGR
jgi:phytoene synthase